MTRAIVVDIATLAENVVASESWAGTNGAAWPSQWATLANAGAGTIQSNRGRLLPNGTGYLPYRRAITGLAVQNVEAYVEFTPTALQESYIDLSVRQNLARPDYYPDGYFVSCDIGGTVWTLGGVDAQNGQFNNVDTTITWELTTYSIRLRAEPHPTVAGSSLVSAKVWKTSTTEPAAWVKQITDGSYMRAGSVALGISSGNTTNPPMDWDNLRVVGL